MSAFELAIVIELALGVLCLPVFAALGLVMAYYLRVAANTQVRLVQLSEEGRRIAEEGREMALRNYNQAVQGLQSAQQQAQRGSAHFQQNAPENRMASAPQPGPTGPDVIPLPGGMNGPASATGNAPWGKRPHFGSRPSDIEQPPDTSG